MALGERQMSLYPISRNALASGSPQKPWASPDISRTNWAATQSVSRQELDHIPPKDTMCHGCVSRASGDLEITVAFARLTQPWHVREKSRLAPIG